MMEDRGVEERGGTVRCPLCGATFDPADLPTCALCPLGDSCDLGMCPRCGYEFPLALGECDAFRRP